MFTLNEKPPAFAARAVGILEGRLSLTPSNGERSITLSTPDGGEIPGVVHGRAADSIIENPLLLAVPVRALVYPRTHKSRLEIIAVDIEEAGTEVSKENDFFLIQGMNIGSRLPDMAQISIRPNRRSKHQFKKFWLSLYGHLVENQRCVYKLKALRKGRKLFILESEPILPPSKCSPKRILSERSLIPNS